MYQNRPLRKGATSREENPCGLEWVCGRFLDVAPAGEAHKGERLSLLVLVVLDIHASCATEADAKDEKAADLQLRRCSTASRIADRPGAS